MEDLIVLVIFIGILALKAYNAYSEGYTRGLEEEQAKKNLGRK